MRDYAMDVLLRMGMPAGVKGIIYICDALELFDTDPYYPEGKISSLYADIAKKHETTASRVERAIRHAFEIALLKGNQEMLERYLDVANAQNSNLLKSLYFRISQEKKQDQEQVQASACSGGGCQMKEQIYQEAMEVFFAELETMIARRLAAGERRYEFAGR